MSVSKWMSMGMHALTVWDESKEEVCFWGKEKRRGKKRKEKVDDEGKWRGFMCVQCRAHTRNGSVRKYINKTHTHKMDSALYFIILHLVDRQRQRTEDRGQYRVYKGL